MAIGIIGQKAGMSRIFKEGGISVPCTIIRVVPNRVLQVKTAANDGYQALQLVGGNNEKASKITRPMKGHFRKMSVQAGKEVREFRVADSEMKKAGSQIGVEIFSEGQKVRITGISKGKGFAGTIKRHNFHGQDNSHGNSLSHRVMGSVGQCQFPGRVFKGKKMPGQMGNERVTIKNLEIVKVDKEHQLLWIKGAVPGCRNNTVLIRHLSDIDIQAVSPDIESPQEQPATVATAVSPQATTAETKEPKSATKQQATTAETKEPKSATKQQATTAETKEPKSATKQQATEAETSPPKADVKTDQQSTSPIAGEQDGT